MKQQILSRALAEIDNLESEFYRAIARTRPRFLIKLRAAILHRYGINPEVQNICLQGAHQAPNTELGGIEKRQPNERR